MNIYLLSYETVENGGGVYRYSLANGKFEKTGYFPCDRPMYAALRGEKLHLLLRAPFQASNESGYAVLDNFRDFGGLKGTKGVCACHLDVENDDTYIVNYLSGNAVKNCSVSVQHEGKGVHAKRQEAPHTHFVSVTPDRKHVIVTDLGLDTLFIYDRDMNETDRVRVPDGYGIRHCVFSKDGKKIFAMDELIPAISVFDYQNGKATYLYTVDIPCSAKEPTGAAIRLSDDGNYLFASVRAENTLYSFKIIENGLQKISKVDCGGDFPRDIEVIGDRYLVSCNERSEYAVLFAVCDGKITEVLDRTEIKACLNCVK